MATLTDVIEFLLELLRDEDAQAQFEADPQAALAERGLETLSAQDVRDALLVIGDDEAARPVDDARPAPGGDDPVEQIRFATTNLVAAPAQPAPPDIVENNTFVTIDDRDTLIVDSFNDESTTTTDVVAIDADNSFNESVDVLAIDADNAFNEVAPADGGDTPKEAQAPQAEELNPPVSADVEDDEAAESPLPDDESEPIEPDTGTELDLEPVDEADADPTADVVAV